MSVKAGDKVKLKSASNDTAVPGTVEFVYDDGTATVLFEGEKNVVRRDQDKLEVISTEKAHWLVRNFR